MQFQLPFLFYDIVRPSLLLVFFLLLEIEDFVLDSRHWCQVNFAREEQEAGDDVVIVYGQSLVRNISCIFVKSLSDQKQIQQVFLQQAKMK